MTTKQGELVFQPASHNILADIYWRPNRDTIVAFVSYILVVAALFMAFQIFTTDRVAANFITFGPIALAGFGVAIPLTRLWY